MIRKWLEARHTRQVAAWFAPTTWQPERRASSGMAGPEADVPRAADAQVPRRAKVATRSTPRARPPEEAADPSSEPLGATLEARDELRRINRALAAELTEARAEVERLAADLLAKDATIERLWAQLNEASNVVGSNPARTSSTCSPIPAGPCQSCDQPASTHYHLLGGGCMNSEVRP